MTTVRSAADRLLDLLAAELGDASVTRDTAAFADPYRPAGEPFRGPAGVVFPTSTEQVRTVLRLAQDTGVPVWTHSVGRNYGYGGAEARVTGSIALSLRRMNRILDIDDVHGVAVIEPGVTFFDLSAALRAGGHRFGISVPDLGWGSVLGNALDHGVGYTGAGEHVEQLCGLEVVLANGDVLRTGTGGITGAATFHLRPRGFGPALDGLFGQSNLGVVTRAGVWLAPEPECFLAGRIGVPHERDLPALVDTLRPLMLDGTITGLPMIGHAFGRIAAGVPRAEWPPLSGAGTEAELAPLLARLGQTIWSARISLAGHRRVVAAQRAIVEDAVRALSGATVDFSEHEPPYTADTLPPPAQVPAGVPNMGLMRVLGPWGGHDGTAGHLDLSPATPFTGSAAWQVFSTVHGRLRPDGIPAASAVLVRRRSLVFVNMLLYDRSDGAAVRAVESAYRDLLAQLGAQGHGLYRTHIDHADAVADLYDFGDHALHRTLRTIKDALDPAGILSPGKQGVWPSAHPRPQEQP